MPDTNSRPIKQVLEKEKITVLITDSGLGGIAICAEVAAALSRCHHYREVSLIYFNAWPQQDRGYNRLRDNRERIRVFDSALNGMQQFEPDLILIACNTLSVLYPSTAFSRQTDIPVVDIVEFGVDLVGQALLSSAEASVVILGTVTTIESGVHRKRLHQDGIPTEKIVSQPCDQLATSIEKGPASDEVQEMIGAFMKEASKKIDSRSPHVYAALCCTHFAYCQELIRKALSDLTGKSVTILNPNQQMADFLVSRCRQRYSFTQMNIKVVSKIIWETQKIKAISGCIQPISMATAKALKTYSHIPDLFD